MPEWVGMIPDILTSVEALITALVMFFVAIAKVTPTKKDDPKAARAQKIWRQTQVVIDKVTPFIPSRVEPEPEP